MALLLLIFVLWLPILMGVATIVLLIVLVAWAIRRRLLSRGATGMQARWPTVLAILSSIVVIFGTAPIVELIILHRVEKSGTPLELANRKMTGEFHGCAKLPITQWVQFIAEQPAQYRHELEGGVLRLITHCINPMGDETQNPETVLSADERAQLHRMASTHRRRPSPGPITSENYRPSWADEADSIDGMLQWQEHGLEAFDEIMESPNIPASRRTIYLGFAARHCLLNPVDADCSRAFSMQRLEILYSNNNRGLAGYMVGNALYELHTRAVAATKAAQEEIQTPVAPLSPPDLKGLRP